MKRERNVEMLAGRQSRQDGAEKSGAERRVEDSRKTVRQAGLG